MLAKGAAHGRPGGPAEFHYFHRQYFCAVRRQPVRCDGYGGRGRLPPRSRASASCPSTAFALALTTFVSQNLGAGEYDRGQGGGALRCDLLHGDGRGRGAADLPAGARSFCPFSAATRTMIAIGVKDARTVTPFFFLMALYPFRSRYSARLRARPIVPMGVISICWCLVRVIYISLFSASFTDTAPGGLAVYPNHLVR